jgi:2-isopropylmalate synthase
VRTMRHTERYSPFSPISLTDRRWPGRTITSAPRWLSTDLRDGNQALVSPMDPVRKLAMFDLLVGMGYKEIEVGFPVASRDDHDFVRLLIEQDKIPEDVTISVLVQARDDLIKRTVASLAGARNATIHLYNATSPLFRQVVFGMTRDECKNLAVDGTRLMMKHTESILADCQVGFEYSPEIFNETELDFALEVCEAVMDVWQPDSDREIILNFPATVERATPNIFADQIEWLDRNISRRDFVCLSIHPHNDRGTGVAAAELAMLAGAQRIEGCLLGSGERAGNVDLVTLGLNLYTQGVDPGIDFSDIPGIRRVVESCNQMDIHPRHPYAGDLIYTALSGSHQDAIKKGFDAMTREADSKGLIANELPWRMPYLPIDPIEVGRTYEAIVRINSQSGKGGVAYIMDAWHGMDLPAGLRAEFARQVQVVAEEDGGELTPAVVGRLFEAEYLAKSVPLTDQPSPSSITLYIDENVTGADSDCVRALSFCLTAWGTQVEVVRRAAVQGQDSSDASAGHLVYAECVIGGYPVWGAGRSNDIIGAASAAIGSSFGRVDEVIAAGEVIAAEELIAVGGPQE